MTNANSSFVIQHPPFLYAGDVRIRRDGGRLRHGSLRIRLAVNQLLELLARLEVRNLLRRHVHLVARLRVAPLPWLAPPQPKAAESAQFDLLAAMQRVDDA